MMCISSVVSTHLNVYRLVCTRHVILLVWTYYLWRIVTNKFQDSFSICKIQILTFHLFFFTVESLVLPLAYSNSKVYPHFHSIQYQPSVTCVGVSGTGCRLVCEVGLRFQLLYYWIIHLPIFALFYPHVKGNWQEFFSFQGPSPLNYTDI